MKAAIIDQYRITKTSAEERLKEMQSAYKKLVDEKGSLEDRIVALTKELNSNKELHDTELNVETKRLKEQYELSKFHINELELQEKDDEHKKCLEEASSQTAKCKSELKTLMSEKEALNSSNKELRDICENIKKESEMSKTTIKMLEDYKKKSEEEKEELRAAYTKLEADHKELLERKSVLVHCLGNK